MGKEIEIDPSEIVSMTPASKSAAPVEITPDQIVSMEPVSAPQEETPATAIPQAQARAELSTFDKQALAAMASGATSQVEGVFRRASMDPDSPEAIQLGINGLMAEKQRLADVLANPHGTGDMDSNEGDTTLPPNVIADRANRIQAQIDEQQARLAAANQPHKAPEIPSLGTFVRDEYSNIADRLAGQKQLFQNFYGADPNDQSFAAQAGRGVGGAVPMMVMAANGPVGMALGVGQASSQAYADTFDATGSHEKAAEAARNAALAMGPYMATGRLAANLTAPLLKSATPFMKGLISGTAATAANMGASAVNRAIEGKPLAPTVEGTFADATFGLGSHGVHTFLEAKAHEGLQNAYAAPKTADMDIMADAHDQIQGLAKDNGVLYQPENIKPEDRPTLAQAIIKVARGTALDKLSPEERNLLETAKLPDGKPFLTPESTEDTGTQPPRELTADAGNWLRVAAPKAISLVHIEAATAMRERDIAFSQWAAENKLDLSAPQRVFELSMAAAKAHEVSAESEAKLGNAENAQKERDLAALERENAVNRATAAQAKINSAVASFDAAFADSAAKKSAPPVEAKSPNPEPAPETPEAKLEKALSETPEDLAERVKNIRSTAAALQESNPEEAAKLHAVADKLEGEQPEPAGTPETPAPEPAPETPAFTPEPISVEDAHKSQAPVMLEGQRGTVAPHPETDQANPTRFEFRPENGGPSVDLNEDSKLSTAQPAQEGGDKTWQTENQTSNPSSPQADGGNQQGSAESPTRTTGTEDGTKQPKKTDNEAPETPAPAGVPASIKDMAQRWTSNENLAEFDRNIEIQQGIIDKPESTPEDVQRATAIRDYLKEKSGRLRELQAERDAGAAELAKAEKTESAKDNGPAPEYQGGFKADGYARDALEALKKRFPEYAEMIEQHREEWEKSIAKTMQSFSGGIEKAREELGKNPGEADLLLGEAGSLAEKEKRSESAKPKTTPFGIMVENMASAKAENGEAPNPLKKWVGGENGTPREQVPHKFVGPQSTLSNWLKAREVDKAGVASLDATDAEGNPTVPEPASENTPSPDQAAMSKEDVHTAMDERVAAATNRVLNDTLGNFAGPFSRDNNVSPEEGQAALKNAFRALSKDSEFQKAIQGLTSKRFTEAASRLAPDALSPLERAAAKYLESRTGKLREKFIEGIRAEADPLAKFAAENGVSASERVRRNDEVTELDGMLRGREGVQEAKDIVASGDFDKVRDAAHSMLRNDPVIRATLQRELHGVGIRDGQSPFRSRISELMGLQQSAEDAPSYSDVITKLSLMEQEQLNELLDSPALPESFRTLLRGVNDLTGDNALEAFIKLGSKEVKEVAQAIKDGLAEGSRVNLVNNFGLAPGMSQGLWHNWKRATIHVSPFLRGDQWGWTGLHETMHALADHKIVAYLDPGQRHLLTKSEIASLDELSRLLKIANEEAQKRFAAEPEGPAKEELRRNLFGTYDKTVSEIRLREFVSEALNHREFQDFLAGIQDPQAGKGVLSVLRSALTRIMSVVLGRNVSDTSVLVRALEHGVKLTGNIDRATGDMAGRMRQQMGLTKDFLGGEEQANKAARGELGPGVERDLKSLFDAYGIVRPYREGAAPSTAAEALNNLRADVLVGKRTPGELAAQKAAMESVRVPFAAAKGRELRGVLGHAVPEEPQHEFFKPEDYESAKNTLRAVIENPDSVRLRARGKDRFVNMRSPDEAVARQLGDKTGQRWDGARAQLEARAIHALTENDRVTPDPEKIATAQLVPQTLQQADFVSEREMKLPDGASIPLLVFSKLYADPSSPTGERWHFVEVRKNGMLFETQYSKTDMGRDNRAFRSIVVGVGDTAKKEALPGAGHSREHATGKGSGLPGNPQGMLPDVSPRQGSDEAGFTQEASGSVRTGIQKLQGRLPDVSSVGNIDTTSRENVQPKVEDIMGEIEHLESKRERMLKNGDYDGAAKVDAQIKELDATWNKLGNAEKTRAASSETVVTDPEGYSIRHPDIGSAGATNIASSVGDANPTSANIDTTGRENVQGKIQQSEAAHGFEFVSPNDSDAPLTLDEAQKQLGSQKQKDFRAYAGKVDAIFSPDAKATDALGDWADGAEPTTVTTHTGDISYEDLKVSTALKSAFSNQKAGIPFKVEPQGEQFLYEFHIPGKDAREARDIVSNAGIEFRTLVEQKDGTTVYVFDSPETPEAGQELADKVKNLVTTNNYEHSFKTGRGEFLGSWTSREEGRQIYRATVEGALARYGVEGHDAGAGDADSLRAARIRDAAREAGLLQPDTGNPAAGLSGPEAKAFSAITGEPLQSEPVKPKSKTSQQDNEERIPFIYTAGSGRTNPARGRGSIDRLFNALHDEGGSDQGAQGGVEKPAEVDRQGNDRRGSEGADSGDSRKDREAAHAEATAHRLAELDSLYAYAKDNGLVLAAPFFKRLANEKTHIGDGAEHTVFFNKPTGRVIKVVHEDEFNLGEVAQTEGAKDYVQSLMLNNLMLRENAGDLQFEGVVKIGGKPQVVISQEAVNGGKEATTKQIARDLKLRGFKFDGEGAWVHPLGVKMSDAVPNNVLVDKDGKLVYIDVYMQPTRPVSEILKDLNTDEILDSGQWEKFDESSPTFEEEQARAEKLIAANYGPLQSEPTREPRRLDANGHEVEDNPYIPQFQPKVFKADERAATQALDRVRNTPEFANVADALKEKTYFKETAPETVDKAHEYIASFNGDYRNAFEHAETSPGLTNMQGIVARGLILKQVAKAENLARDAATKTTDPARRADLLTLAEHYHDQVSEFGSKMANASSAWGQEGVALRIIADSFAPQSYVQAYKAPIIKAQGEALDNNPAAQEIVNGLGRAKARAATDTSSRMQAVFDRASEHFLKKEAPGATPEEVSAAQELARQASSPLPVREQVKRAAMEEAVVQGMTAIEDAMTDAQKNSPEGQSFLNVWKNRLRDEASKQLEDYIAERLKGGKVDEAPAPEMTDEEKAAAQEERINDAWRSVGDLPLAEQVFNQARATIEAADTDYSVLVKDAKFDSAKSDGLRRAVKASISLPQEIRKFLGGREQTINTLVAKLVEANPMLTEHQATSLADAVEAVYNQQVEQAAKAELDRMVQASNNPQVRKVLGSEGRFSRLLALSNLGAFGREDSYNALAPAFNLPAWDMDTARKLEEDATAIQRLPEGSIARGEAGQRLMQDLSIAHIAAGGPGKKSKYFMEVLAASWVANTLSGPVTHFVNTVSTQVSTFTEAIAEANGYRIAALKAGATREQAWAFWGDIFKAYRFAFNKDAMGTSVRAFTEAERAFTAGTTKYGSVKTESLATLERYSLDKRVTDPAIKLMAALTEGHLPDIKDTGNLIGGIAKTMAERVATIGKGGAAGAINDLLATQKMVGRGLEAQDAFNGQFARPMKMFMAQRYEALTEPKPEGVSQEAWDKQKQAKLDAIGKDALQEVKDQAIAQATKEETLGGYGEKGTREFALNKARRVEQLIEEATYGADILDRSMDFAAHVMYRNQHEGYVGLLTNALFGPDMRKACGGLGSVLTPLNPFSRVAASIVNQSISFSPYGFLRAEGTSLSDRYLDDTSRFKRTAPEKGSPEYYAARSKAFAGTAMLSMLGALTAMAVKAAWEDEDKSKKEPFMWAVHGTGPADAALNAQWKAAGNRPYSLRVGGASLEFKDIPHVSLVLGMLGELHDRLVWGRKENRGTDNDVATRIGNAMMGAIGVTTSRTFLSGLSAIAEALSSNASDSARQRAFDQIKASYVTGLTHPALAKFIAAAATGKTYEAKTWEGSYLQYIPMGGMIAGKPKINVLGEPIQKSLYDVLFGRLLPQVPEMHPVLTPLTEAGLRIPPPQTYAVTDPATQAIRPISPEEYYRFTEIYGKTISGILTPQMVQGLAQISARQPQIAQDRLDRIALIARNQAQAQVRQELAVRKTTAAEKKFKALAAQ